ncbi:MAG: response regulator [Burkholderiaceae bacterium]|nr:response regulator [Burkholderiaceae bacterium]
MDLTPQPSPLPPAAADEGEVMPLRALAFPSADDLPAAPAPPAAAGTRKVMPKRLSVKTVLWLGLALLTAWSIGASYTLAALAATQAEGAVPREHLLVMALLTVVAALVLGVAMMRYLVAPIQQLTRRAEDMAQRHAGRTVAGGGNEFDALVHAFDAMTEALLAHSDRLQRAHMNELQNSLELQRQYALMRLLRGLAAAANESDSVEQALERAVEEIGQYLDWPIGRAALLDESEPHDAPRAPSRSIWFVRDRARHAEFIAESERLPPARRLSGLTGRAYTSGMPHWVTDLAHLAGFRRRDVAVACGLKTGVVIPVVARGHIMALIEFFADHRVEASAEMLELVEAIGVELSRVAERHRAERDLRASEAEARRLALVASRTDKAVLLLDPGGRVQWVNEAFARWTGVALEAARGRRAHRLVRRLESAPQVMRQIAQGLAQGEPCRLEIVARGADGARGIHEVEGQPLHDETGRFVQYALLATEITRLKDTEAALRSSESFFRVLFENSPVAAAIQGADYRLGRVNAAYARLLGRSADEMIGRDLIEFVHVDDRPEQLAQRRTPLRQGEVTAFERRMVRHDGQVLRARVHAASMAGADQERLYLLVIEDVTDIRASEQKLREAKDAAESASRAKSQFLANMSHEIRTPMNGVLGMTELLLGTALSDKQRRFAEAVYRSGESLLAIINDILDFSKIEAGKLELQACDFDLRTLVEDVFELLAARAAEKRVELACRVGPGVPQVVHGDPVRLRQVLTNLVGNAIKFTERGEVLVQVGAAPACEGGSLPLLQALHHEAESRQLYRVDFEVRDTGIGIRPDVLGRLFTSFMQADQSMSRRYGGTGLGLAISRQLVELMGGSISAESRVGVGSVFRFDVLLAGGTLPLALPPASAALLAGRRVLVVDDNPTNRSILEGQLRAFGAEVTLAEHGAQALALLQATAQAGRRFDAAVVDLKMPVMDGMTLVQAIRRDAELDGLGVVMLTSLAGSGEARLARESGVDAYLAKPVRQQALVEALAGALQARARPPDPARPAQGVRVLLVEDNAVNQQVARAMLDDLGACVRLAANGREALDALARESFDLVLMDCQMPEMDGFEALQRLRDPALTPHLPVAARTVPVVALTANALAGDAERCRVASFDAYLPKPVKQGQLAQIVQQHGGTKSTAGPAAEAAAPAQDGAAVDAAGTEVDSAAVLDAAVIERIVDMERRGAPNLLARLVATYLDSAAKLVAAAERALADHDGPALRQAVHTLKSSSANLAATEFAARCAELEALARDGAVAQARLLWPAARAEYERAVRALRGLGANGAAHDLPGSAPRSPTTTLPNPPPGGSVACA